MRQQANVDPSPIGGAGGRFVIVVGGDGLLPLAAAACPADSFVIAADSGLDRALAAGLQPDLVVGDFDSVTPEGLDWARRNDVTLQRHPIDKDSTDTELALETAIAMGAASILMLGGGGDRLDHSIGALTALGHESLAGCASVEAHWGDSSVSVLHGPRSKTLDLAVDETFSLLALHGRCTGIRVSGSKWPLEDALIDPGSSLGVSNVCVTTPVSVSIEQGVLTVIVPHRFSLNGGRR